MNNSSEFHSTAKPNNRGNWKANAKSMSQSKLHGKPSLSSTLQLYASGQECLNLVLLYLKSYLPDKDIDLAKQLKEWWIFNNRELNALHQDVKVKNIIIRSFKQGLGLAFNGVKHW